MKGIGWPDFRHDRGSSFLSGDAGTGKSFVLKTLHYALSKMAREDDKHLEHDIQKPTVAIGALCGLAA